MAVSYYKLAYGTILSMAVGSSVYVAGLSYVTREQIVEATEGVLEREAAISPWPLTNYSTNKAGWNTRQARTVSGITIYQAVSGTNSDTFAGTNWNYNPFLGIPLIGSGPSRDLITNVCMWVERRGTNFLYDVTNGVPVYLTHSNIWELANIGGSNYPNWTIGCTNGVKIYGPITNLFWHGQAYVLDEQIRALKIMTTTSRTASWQPGITEGYVAMVPFQGVPGVNWYIDDSAYAVLKTDPPPGWWTNIVGYGWLVNTGGYSGTAQDAKVYGSHLQYGGGTIATAAPSETIGFYGPTNATYERVTWTDFPQYWLYRIEYGSGRGQESATRHTASGGVWIANLASGVTVNVSIPWAYTGAWENVSGNYESNTVTTSAASLTGTGTAVVTCSGVATGWAGLASILPPQGLTNVIDVAAQEATGVWTNFADLGNSVVYSNSPPPSLTGWSSNWITGPAILRWTFTRCRP